MSRISTDTIDKLNEFFKSLPAEVRSKCTFCSTTLRHLVNLAEIETGAGTAIATRIIAERINQDRLQKHTFDSKIGAPAADIIATMKPTTV